MKKALRKKLPENPLKLLTRRARQKATVIPSGTVIAT